MGFEDEVEMPLDDSEIAAGAFCDFAAVWWCRLALTNPGGLFPDGATATSARGVNVVQRREGRVPQRLSQAALHSPS